MTVPIKTMIVAVVMAAGIAFPAYPAASAAVAMQNNGQQSQPAKKKKPEEPIDPDTSAGVRGSAGTHTVRVLYKDKPVEAAHVVVRNTNGSVAASCYTSATGECQLSIGADKYTIEATHKDDAGSITIAVEDSTGPIVILMKKAKATSSAPQQ